MGREGKRNGEERKEEEGRGWEVPPPPFAISWIRLWRGSSSASTTEAATVKPN